MIANGGPVDEDEMRRTFNLGVGLAVVMAKEEAERALEALCGAGEQAWRFGEVIEVGDVAYEDRVRFEG